MWVRSLCVAGVRCEEDIQVASDFFLFMVYRNQLDNAYNLAALSFPFPINVAILSAALLAAHSDSFRTILVSITQKALGFRQGLFCFRVLVGSAFAI